MARKLKIDNGGKVWAPYSPGITVRDHIWLAGQIGIEGGDDVVSHNDLISAGYTDASSTDLMATRWFNKTNKVGLVFH